MRTGTASPSSTSKRPSMLVMVERVEDELGAARDLLGAPMGSPSLSGHDACLGPQERLAQLLAWGSAGGPPPVHRPGGVSLVLEWARR